MFYILESNQAPVGTSQVEQMCGRGSEVRAPWGMVDWGAVGKYYLEFPSVQPR